MDTQTHSKNRIILGRAFALLALPVTLSAMVTMATVKNPQEQRQEPGIDASEKLSMAEQVFRSDWGSASPAVYTQIAQAFASPDLQSTALRRVECRQSLCKVTLEGDGSAHIAKVLPRQLARSFRAIVTIHATEKQANETLVYIDIPSSA